MKPHQLETYRTIKEKARQDTWCTVHFNCFRASFPQIGDKKIPESPEHIDKKLERWKYWRREGFNVFVELILADGTRPDLIVFNENEVFIEEIVVSEKKLSILKKKKEYPFEVFVFEIE